MARTAVAEPELANGEIVHVPSIDPLQIIKYSLENGVQPAQLKEMMDLANQWRAQEAADRFGKAMATVQHECPLIFKGRQADRYTFAGFDDIWTVVRPIASRSGLSVSFSQPKADAGWYEIIVHLRVGLHTESRPFSVPLEGLQGILQAIADKQKLTLPQAYGFWLSYQKRYAFCAALNIVVTNEDNDAAGFSNSLATPDEVAEIKSLLSQLSALGKAADPAAFLAWLGRESFDEVTVKDYEKGVRDIRGKISKAKNGGAK